MIIVKLINSIFIFSKLLIKLISRTIFYPIDLVNNKIDKVNNKIESLFSKNNNLNYLYEFPKFSINNDYHEINNDYKKIGKDMYKSLNKYERDKKFPITPIASR
ncbi:hypothetical protein WR164_03440 [Philodulcilactobacillus myokoensis]|uniref:Uncharacterized protein n=1 Tax=Philodulcilactobacillus myokoensis TaxID=2929573 RepID=A0A9W6B0N2_9LACO|nr:hypothetical protein WR164_03440 [Philodulcilactobacillus myokoensis]